jgi:hypothetical protein
MGWQRKVECGRLPGKAGGPNTAILTVDDSLHGCQTDASAWKLAGEVQSLKEAEESVSEFHIKPRAIVSRKIRRLPSGLQTNRQLAQTSARRFNATVSGNCSASDNLGIEYEALAVAQYTG